MPDEVTIQLDGSPLGLVAIVDGRAVDFPMKVRRGSTPFTATFRAPGFLPEQVEIHPVRDEILRLQFRIQATGTDQMRGKAGGSREYILDF
jgi:hypothetical protein